MLQQAFGDWFSQSQGLIQLRHRVKAETQGSPPALLLMEDMEHHPSAPKAQLTIGILTLPIGRDVTANTSLPRHSQGKPTWLQLFSSSQPVCDLRGVNVLQLNRWTQIYSGVNSLSDVTAAALTETSPSVLRGILARKRRTCDWTLTSLL
ncbi:hypothetical protein MHYP_G00137190 [Metynnis hypsauchen]